MEQRTGPPRRQLEACPTMCPTNNYSWEASLSHLSRVATEARARAYGQWISDHVRPDNVTPPHRESGLRRKQLRRARRSLASRYYQLLSGHAAKGSFLHERISGP